MKMIIIRSCEDCPFSQWSDYINHCGNANIITDDNSLPDNGIHKDCPLEDTTHTGLLNIKREEK